MLFTRAKQWCTILSIALLVLACGGRKIKPDLTAEERLEVAKELFADKKYYDAKQQLTILTYSHRGSAVADEAQYYLAECHYYLKEYILAISEYQRLIDAYQNSEYVDDAQYKLGMSYFELSPSSGLDQEYSQKAIQHFQRFLEDYPNSTLRPAVEESYRICREKLARKEFDNGNLYRKMRLYEAAIVYFDGVLEQYYDTKYAEKAGFWRAECYFKLKKYSESMQCFEQFLDRYQRSSYVERAQKRLKEIKALINSTTSAVTYRGERFGT